MPRSAAACLLLVLLAAVAGIIVWQSNANAEANIEGEVEPLWQWVDTTTGTIERFFKRNLITK